MKKITEQPSPYRHLEKMNVRQLLTLINQEDQTVARAVAGVIPELEPLVEHIVGQMSGGGRLMYIGAGTSGRLGIVDASECPPTFGVPADWVIGIIAGGDDAIRKAVEFAEDDIHQGWKDLSFYQVDRGDLVMGISASGSTPYVVNALKDCRHHQIPTACLTANPDTPLARQADYPIEVITGPEFVTGSTRMKAGTAQKLVLNMISTSVMIRLGRVQDNQMVDMQLTNQKLLERGTRILQEAFEISAVKARQMLDEHGSVRGAMQHLHRRL